MTHPHQSMEEKNDGDAPVTHADMKALKDLVVRLNGEVNARIDALAGKMVVHDSTSLVTSPHEHKLVKMLERASMNPWTIFEEGTTDTWTLVFGKLGKCTTDHYYAVSAAHCCYVGPGEGFTQVWLPPEVAECAEAVLFSQGFLETWTAPHLDVVAVRLDSQFLPDDLRLGAVRLPSPLPKVIPLGEMVIGASASMTVRGHYLSSNRDGSYTFVQSVVAPDADSGGSLIYTLPSCPSPNTAPTPVLVGVHVETYSANNRRPQGVVAPLSALDCEAKLIRDADALEGYAQSPDLPNGKDLVVCQSRDTRRGANDAYLLGEKADGSRGFIIEMSSVNCPGRR